MEAPLSRTVLLQEIRKMRFEEAYGGWQEKRLTQGEAAELLGMSERNFRRYVGRYEADGLNGLIDLRIEQVSSRRAPVDEVMRLVDLYQSRHDGWNVKHFHAWYRKDQVGARSYSWVKNAVQGVDRDCPVRLPRADANMPPRPVMHEHQRVEHADDPHLPNISDAQGGREPAQQIGACRLLHGFESQTRNGGLRHSRRSQAARHQPLRIPHPLRRVASDTPPGLRSTLAFRHATPRLIDACPKSSAPLPKIL